MKDGKINMYHLFKKKERKREQGLKALEDVFRSTLKQSGEKCVAENKYMLRCPTLIFH